MVRFVPPSPFLSHRSYQLVSVELTTITERQALTATATDRIQADIIKALKLRSPEIVRSSIDRPNLYFAASKKRATYVRFDLM